MIRLLCLLLLLPTLAHAAYYRGAGVPFTGQQVTISGSQFMKDGVPWVPKGVAIIALTAPSGFETNSTFVAAKAEWLAHMTDEIAQIKAYGADLIRLNVSQCGLDPSSGMLTPAQYNAYLNMIYQSVAAIRAAGLPVMIMMQDESASGCQNSIIIPDQGTVRALLALTPLWTNDKGVFFEIYNEPGNCQDNPACITAWHYQQQMLVWAIRARGISNVLVVPGFKTSRYLNNPGVGMIQPVQDRYNQVAYSVHPYQNVYLTDADLTTYFSSACTTLGVACIASEWHLDPWGLTCVDVQPPSDAPTVANTIFSGLQSRGIGVVLWAWDFLPTLNQDYTVNTLTDMNTSFTCDKSQSPPQGVGVMGHEYFSQ